MAPITLATSPNSDKSPFSTTFVDVFVYLPVFQVPFFLGMVAFVLRYLGSRVSTIDAAQAKSTLTVDIELQAQAPGVVLLRRSRFWWFRSLFRQLRSRSHDTWLYYTSALRLLRRDGPPESLPLPVLTHRASSSFTVTSFFRKLLGRIRIPSSRTRIPVGRTHSLPEYGVKSIRPELSYPAVWASPGVVFLVARANFKFAPAETHHHQETPYLQTQTSTTPTQLRPISISLGYTPTCAPSGITPAGVG
ncbi:hypothetical protein C8Q77DRAFT_742431 [Trametes polyzona]|nr:hypothetical protein C8Q77DRAFT_742431 [Trametes polyzona]